MKRTWRNRLFSAWDMLFIHTNRLFSTLSSRLSLRFQGCRYGRDLRTMGACYFKARTAGSISLGHHVCFVATWRANRVGLSGPLLLHTMGEGRIEVGDHSGASSAVLSARSLIRVGKYVKLGGNVRIFDHDFHPLDAGARRLDRDEECATAPVVIGDDVFIGANAIILKGVTLGNRVVVGAGSVVASSFEDDSVIGGNPARLLRQKSQKGLDAGVDSSGAGQ